MSYELVSIREPRWRGVTLEQGERYLSRLLAAWPPRAEYLAGETDISWVYSRSGITSVQRPLRRFCSWVDSMPTVKLLPRAGRHAKVEVLNPAVADTLKAMEARMREEPTYVMTPVGESIGCDVGILIGEFIRVRYPWASWAVDDNRRSLFFAAPCLAVKGSKRHTPLPVFQVAYTIVSRAAEDRTGLLREIVPCLESWMELFSPPPWPTRGAPRKAGSAAARPRPVGR